MKKIIISALLLTTSIFATQSSPFVKSFINEKNCDFVLDKQVFDVCYSKRYNSPIAVGYTITKDKIIAKGIEERDKFYSESLLPMQYRLKTSDYTGTGYDRGHLASDATFDYSDDSLAKTYSMANISPMSPNLNRKTWIKAEEYERMAAVKLGSVDVVDLVFYDKNPPLVGKKHNVNIPSTFVKILKNKEKSFEKCFVYKNEMPNSNIFSNQKINETIDVSSDKLENHLIDCSKINF